MQYSYNIPTSKNRPNKSGEKYIKKLIYFLESFDLSIFITFTRAKKVKITEIGITKNHVTPNTTLLLPNNWENKYSTNVATHNNK